MISGSWRDREKQKEQQWAPKSEERPRGGGFEDRGPRGGDDRGPRDAPRDAPRGGDDRGPRDGPRGGDDRGPRGGDDRGPRDAPRGGDGGGGSWRNAPREDRGFERRDDRR